MHSAGFKLTTPAGEQPQTHALDRAATGTATSIYLSIWQTVHCFHIFLRPFNNYIIFFLQLLLSFQSSSINPLGY